MAAVTERGGSTGAQLPGEQVLNVLQLQALGLWEAAQDEEETQHHQACVHEERPWRREPHVLVTVSILSQLISLSVPELFYSLLFIILGIYMLGCLINVKSLTKGHLRQLIYHSLVMV